MPSSTFNVRGHKVRSASRRRYVVAIVQPRDWTAIVRSWDSESKSIVTKSITLEPIRYTAWDLIGFDGTREVLDRNLGENPGYAEPEYEARPARVRLVGGRTLYEAVGDTGGAKVRLGRLLDRNGNIAPGFRYVDPDAQLEVIEG